MWWKGAGWDPASAGRHAIVIGNDQYTSGLSNSRQSAKRFHEVLVSRYSFKTVYLENATNQQMVSAGTDLVRRCRVSSSKTPIAVLFFSGHSESRDNKQVLLGIDVKVGLFGARACFDLQKFAKDLAGSAPATRLLLFLDTGRVEVSPEVADLAGLEAYSNLLQRPSASPLGHLSIPPVLSHLVLSACEPSAFVTLARSGETGLEDAEVPPSAFTDALSKVLSSDGAIGGEGSGAEKEGVMAGKGGVPLVDLVSRQVKSVFKETGGRECPWLWTNFREPWVLTPVIKQQQQEGGGAVAVQPQGSPSPRPSRLSVPPPGSAPPSSAPALSSCLSPSASAQAADEEEASSPSEGPDASLRSPALSPFQKIPTEPDQEESTGWAGGKDSSAGPILPIEEVQDAGGEVPVTSVPPDDSKPAPASSPDRKGSQRRGRRRSAPKAAEGTHYLLAAVDGDGEGGGLSSSSSVMPEGPDGRGPSGTVGGPQQQQPPPAEFLEDLLGVVRYERKGEEDGVIDNAPTAEGGTEKILDAIDKPESSQSPPPLLSSSSSAYCGTIPTVQIRLPSPQEQSASPSAGGVVTALVVNNRDIPSASGSGNSPGGLSSSALSPEQQSPPGDCASPPSPIAVGEEEEEDLLSFDLPDPFTSHEIFSGSGPRVRLPLGTDGCLVYEGGSDAEGGRSGSGVAFWANGDKFTGSFEKGVREGEGIYWWFEGGRYAGQWVEDKREGKGVFLFPDDCSVYEGGWEKDVMHGPGRMLFGVDHWLTPRVNRGEGGDGKEKEQTHDVVLNADGCAFWGEWKEGSPDGFGVLIDVAKRVLFGGIWSRGQPVSRCPPPAGVDIPSFPNWSVRGVDMGSRGTLNESSGSSRVGAAAASPGVSPDAQTSSSAGGGDRGKSFGTAVEEGGLSLESYINETQTELGVRSGAPASASSEQEAAAAAAAGQLGGPQAVVVTQPSFIAWYMRKNRKKDLKAAKKNLEEDGGKKEGASGTELQSASSSSSAALPSPDAAAASSSPAHPLSLIPPPQDAPADTHTEADAGEVEEIGVLDPVAGSENPEREVSQGAPQMVSIDLLGLDQTVTQETGDGSGGAAASGGRSSSVAPQGASAAAAASRAVHMRARRGFCTVGWPEPTAALQEYVGERETEPETEGAPLQPHGKGVATFANGDRYEGDFVRGAREGRGVYAQSVGGKYDGKWSGEMMHGYGSFAFPDGITRYEGGWVENRMEGYGVMHYGIVEGSKNAYRYEGQWRADLQHGHGTFISPEGKTIYGGRWTLGQPHKLGARMKRLAVDFMESMPVIGHVTSLGYTIRGDTDSAKRAAGKATSNMLSLGGAIAGGLVMGPLGAVAGAMAGCAVGQVGEMGVNTTILDKNKRSAKGTFRDFKAVDSSVEIAVSGAVSGLTAGLASGMGTVLANHAANTASVVADPFQRVATKYVASKGVSEGVKRHRRSKKGGKDSGTSSQDGGTDTPASGGGGSGVKKKDSLACERIDEETEAEDEEDDDEFFGLVGDGASAPASAAAAGSGSGASAGKEKAKDGGESSGRRKKEKEDEKKNAAAAAAVAREQRLREWERKEKDRKWREKG
uniref:Peptidase C14 caspase domain-containing protein n=1 Tax=Chromera velia CCMP2878 TaxID=1169474 RepID=A0A0G4GKD1_9ALVE|eukprot:Cvel_22304.t1-p1 / transcript=Cvel_22304.t1 / gene=Cvel_22304 / organism=Chromera_velia_CCMP2878 / gene_product=Radial spoke head 1 homolog, putative / transcript_product=Radial spoke head 1 homolog, putative / location=Cvel_scaffold2179:5541-11054(+) / protein_length=1576 / sequence_SO=supercontig / SO=protein_coding / is_pseudo=false